MAEEIPLDITNEINKLSIKQLNSLIIYIENPTKINIEKEYISHTTRYINCHLDNSSASKKLSKNIITHTRKRIKSIYSLIDNTTKNKGVMEILSLYAFLTIKNNRSLIDLKNRDIKAIKNEIELTLLNQNESFINYILSKNFYNPYLNKDPDFKHFINNIRNNPAHNYSAFNHLEYNYIGVKQITKFELMNIDSTVTRELIKEQFIIRPEPLASSYETYKINFQKQAKDLNKIINDKSTEIRNEVIQLISENGIKHHKFSAIDIILNDIYCFTTTKDSLARKIFNIKKKHQQQKFRRNDDKKQKNITLLHIKNSSYSPSTLIQASPAILQKSITAFFEQPKTDQNNLIDSKKHLAKTDLKKQKTMRISKEIDRKILSLAKKHKVSHSQLISLILNFQSLDDLEEHERQAKLKRALRI